MRENGAHMSLIATELQNTSGIGIDSTVYTNARDAGKIDISAYMWNYIGVLGVDTQRTLMPLVNEHLRLEVLSQAGLSCMMISYIQ